MHERRLHWRESGWSELKEAAVMCRAVDASQPPLSDPQPVFEIEEGCSCQAILGFSDNLGVSIEKDSHGGESTSHCSNGVNQFASWVKRGQICEQRNGKKRCAH